MFALRRPQRTSPRRRGPSLPIVSQFPLSRVYGGVPSTTGPRRGIALKTQPHRNWTGEPRRRWPKRLFRDGRRIDARSLSRRLGVAFCVTVEDVGDQIRQDAISNAQPSTHLARYIQHDERIGFDVETI